MRESANTPISNAGSNHLFHFPLTHRNDSSPLILDKLFDIIHEDADLLVLNKPADLANESKVAFPDSYVQNVRKEKRKKLTNPRVWLAVLGVVFLTYLAASHGIWLSLTSRLEQANSEIVEIQRRLDSLPPPTK